MLSHNFGFFYRLLKTKVLHMSLDDTAFLSVAATGDTVLQSWSASVSDGADALENTRLSNLERDAITSMSYGAFGRERDAALKGVGCSWTGRYGLHGAKHPNMSLHHCMLLAASYRRGGALEFHGDPASGMCITGSGDGKGWNATPHARANVCGNHRRHPGWWDPQFPWRCACFKLNRQTNWHRCN